MSAYDSEKIVSIIIPFYNEESNIKPLIEQIRDSISSLNYKFEIIFVNDGSTDASPNLVRGFMSSDKSIKLVNLSRNWGHNAAITAGLSYAKKTAAIIMDADLQDDPKAIKDFIQKWEEGYKVVFAIRKNRKENRFKVGLFNLFYSIQSKLVQIKIPLNAGVFGLIDAVVINEINKLKEQNRYFPGLRAFIGYSQTGILVERNQRFSGEPKVSLKKLFLLALNGIFSFSYVPLRIVTFMGIGITIINLILMFWILYEKIFAHKAILGWSSILISILFMGGIQMISIGIIGEYIGRIYDETKNRQLYIIDSTENLD